MTSQQECLCDCHKQDSGLTTMALPPYCFACIGYHKGAGDFDNK